MASKDWPAPSDGSNQAAFEHLLARHRRLVFKVAATYARDPEDRRDLVQEILIQTWRAYPGYDVRRSFSTWVYRIALNVAISHRRSVVYRSRHVSEIADDDLSAIPDSADHEAADRLRDLYRVIQRLDDLNRALVLLYLDGYNYRETAEVLGISETNVATKLNRIREWLREFATPEGKKGTSWNSKI
jgi:RNA polymerase sigma-70 factor (ECF subfamily)